MSYYRAYQQLSVPAWSRIDMLLAIFGGAVERIQKALAALNAGQRFEAVTLLSKAQLLVAQLSAGVDPNYAEADDMQRLYEFVVHCLAAATPDDVQSGLNVLQTLREGFESIRDEALRMERTGTIARLQARNIVSATA